MFYEVKFFAAVILQDMVLNKNAIYTKLTYSDLGLKSRYWLS